MKSLKTPSGARRGIDRQHAYIDLIKIDLKSRNGNFGKTSKTPVTDHDDAIANRLGDQISRIKSPDPPLP